MAKNNNKKSLILVAAIFVLPVVLAKFALEYNWFNQAATNNGELLEPVLDLTPVYSDEPPKIWRIFYTLPENCDAACQNAIFSINQIWVALGKESDRVQPLVIVTPQSDSQAVKQLNEFPNINLLHANKPEIATLLNTIGSDYIYIADTLQNIILRYDLQTEQQQAVMHSREILADVKKLLKLSRIG